MAMLSSAQRSTAPLSSGAVWPVRRQNSAIAAGMSPGARNSAASGLTNRCNGGAAALSWLRASQSRFAPAEVPGPAALLHEPQAGDVFQQPGRAADAPFVGEIEPQHGVVDHRPGRLDAHQGPGAEADVAPVGPLAGVARRRDGHHRAGRIVRAGQDDLGPLQPGLGGQIRPQRAERRPRLLDPAEKPRGQRKLFQQLRRPSRL